ncbi:MAG: ABC transporter substrate-binding protein, partial [Lachnospiraceae bacterium]|nr:ABC transporter substrate-binding protein [Lachnospiraceae bacterium]
MKRMEKYLALGLAGMLTLALTACGGGGSTTEPAAAPDSAPAETEGEAPAADAGEDSPAAEASGESYDITWGT